MTDQPTRIQRRRVKGWRLPDNAVIVVGTAGGWYEQTYRIGSQVFDRRRVLAELHLLRGKDLACTCPLPEPGEPDHCHAAYLLALANPTP
ncbi:DUF4326 domain-containing protein [Streptomyces sp. NPDC102274]|uniref:DUF4326 domain-containing protein n=1 Tax=Streptomyces sp. NPDC102274 TaxID=3366151 RepID=UPI003819CE6E